MNLRDKLAELRKEKKITQEQLAEKIGISRTTIVNYENGKRKPDYEILQRIADYFGVTTDYLLGRDDQTLEEVEQAIREKDIEEVLEQYRDILTYKGKKISDDEIRKMLTVLKWIYEEREPK